MSYKYGTIDLPQAWSFQQKTDQELITSPEYQAVLNYFQSVVGIQQTTETEETTQVSFVTGSYRDHEFTFNGAGKTVTIGVILAMLNPMIAVLELQKQGVLPPAPIPVFRQDAANVDRPTALGRASDSVGDLIPGFDPPRRILVTAYQGHVPLGTVVTRDDGTWTLTNEFMNPTGEWVRAV